MDPGQKMSFADSHREIRQEKSWLTDPADELGNYMNIYNDIYNDITDREV
ncbi:hypothetical protein MUP29_13690 [bacterium]|nr:hypothetical protein [bacterium]